MTCHCTCEMSDRNTTFIRSTVYYPIYFIYTIPWALTIIFHFKKFVQLLKGYVYTTYMNVDK